jgi:hypothetical protein
MLMKNCAELREHADVCRAMALKAASDEQRSQLEAMALTWDTLAAQRLKLIHCRTLFAG